MANPSPERVPVLTYLTPNKDFLFWEKVDAKKVAARDAGYGSAHWDTVNFPHHKLVLVAPLEQGGQWFQFYYAAERENQDLYNWEHTTADLGGSKFDAVERSYLIPRADYDAASPAQGAVMPEVPEVRFDGEYILAGRKQGRTSERELDSLFVLDVHTYVKRVTIGEVKLDLQTGRSKRSKSTLYHSGEVVTGSSTIDSLAAAPGNAYWGLQPGGVFRELQQLSANWFAVTESTVLPESAVNSLANPAKTRMTERVTPLGTDLIFSEKGAMPSPVPAYGSAHYDTAAFPGYKLSLISPADETGLLHTFFYVKDRSGEDPYNWEHSSADIGGRKFDSVRRTYVTLRSGYNASVPAYGAAMPNTPAGMFSGYVFTGKTQQRTNDPKIDNLYVIVTEEYVRRVTLKQSGQDQPTGRATSTSTTLYHATEVVTGSLTAAGLFTSKGNAYWGLQASGVFRTAEQLSESWFAFTEQSVLPDSSLNSLANPARTRQTNRVTPLGTDVIFSETGAMPPAVPEYGAAHYNSTLWPDHKLALIEPADASGLLFKFTYIANREDQDLYNFSLIKADMGGSKFDAVKRSYLTPRAAFTEASIPLIGTAMPDSPEDVFDAGFILAETSQERIGEQALDNLFVAETYTYVRKVTLGDIGYDEGTGRSTSKTTTLYHAAEAVTGSTTIATLFADKDHSYWGIQVGGTVRTVQRLTDAWFAVTTASVLPESPLNSSSNPAKTRVTERVTPKGTDLIFSEKGQMPAPIPAYGSAHYDTTNYPSHKLVLIKPADASGLMFEFFYVAARANEDDYNWSHSKADIGSTKFDSVTRTYTTLRSAYTPDSPAMGAGMPNIPSGKFPGTYVLAEKSQQRTNDPKIDNLFVIENRTYVKKVALTETGYDPATGRPTRSAATLYYSGEIVTAATTIDTIASTPTNSYLGLQTGGTFREVRQLSEKWWQIVERSVLPESPVNSAANPAKTRITERLTPLGTDLLIVEKGAMPATVPAYGAAHYDTTNYPNHKLVLIKPADEAGLLFSFFYAADWLNQEAYNWDLSEGKQLVRSYLVPRTLYYGRNVAEAAATTPVVAGEFTVPVAAALDTRFPKYGFADDSLVDAPAELQSRYVIIKRRFLRPEVSEIQFDENLELRLKNTFTLVPASMDESSLPADEVGTVYELQPVNAFHSMQVARSVVPESAGWTLADFSRAQATRTNIPNLPRELVSAHVVWNSQFSVGQQDFDFYQFDSGDSFSFGKSANDSASSSAAITPEIQLTFRDIEASNLPATEYEIFIEGDATEEAVLERLTDLAGAEVLAWPVFRPESMTLSTTGQSLRVSVGVQISLGGKWDSVDGITSQGWDKGTSDDFAVNLTTGSVQISPCIHGTIALTGDTARSQGVAATAFMAMTMSLLGSISATRTKAGTAYGAVTPTSVPAVSGPTSIPVTGLYALSIQAGRKLLGHTFVTAVVLDASTLAPPLP